MKLNTDKYHLLASGHRYEEMWTKVGKDRIWESKEVNILGVTIDNKLKFNKHVYTPRTFTEGNLLCACAFLNRLFWIFS